MTDDIVTRLLMRRFEYGAGDLYVEAADEIEHLQAEIEHLRAEVARLGSFLRPIGTVIQGQAVRGD